MGLKSKQPLAGNLSNENLVNYSGLLLIGIGKSELPCVTTNKEEKWEAIIRNMKVTIEI